VNLAARLGLLALLVVAVAGWGCSEASSTSETSINPTPPQVLEPSAPGDAKNAPAAADKPGASKDKPSGSTESEKKIEPAKSELKDPTAKTDAPELETASACFVLATEAEAAEEVTLEPVKYNEMLARIAANKKAKFTIVDAWATWCPPCKENFPHVVKMNTRYASQGLVVISLSLDDPSDGKAVAEAKKFLKAEKAVFTNFLMNEEQDAAFEKLNVNGIPAVFLYGPDGKEIRRFTMDDPNNQFTYDEVEKTVAALLKGEPLPEAK
jgi:thiol-disulfide isomerase/thioredoxin